MSTNVINTVVSNQDRRLLYLLNRAPPSQRITQEEYEKRLQQRHDQVALRLATQGRRRPLKQPRKIKRLLRTFAETSTVLQHMNGNHNLSNIILSYLPEYHILILKRRSVALLFQKYYSPVALRNNLSTARAYYDRVPQDYWHPHQPHPAEKEPGPMTTLCLIVTDRFLARTKETKSHDAEELTLSEFQETSSRGIKHGWSIEWSHWYHAVKKEQYWFHGRLVFQRVWELIYEPFVKSMDIYSPTTGQIQRSMAVDEKEQTITTKNFDIMPLNAESLITWRMGLPITKVYSMHSGCIDSDDSVEESHFQYYPDYNIFINNFLKMGFKMWTEYELLMPLAEIIQSEILCKYLGSNLVKIK